MKKLENESELVAEALKVGAVYAKSRRVGQFEATDSAKDKARFLYSLLVHDKLIQPLAKGDESGLRAPLSDANNTEREIHKPIGKANSEVNGCSLVKLFNAVKRLVGRALWGYVLDRFALLQALARHMHDFAPAPCESIKHIASASFALHRGAL